MAYTAAALLRAFEAMPPRAAQIIQRVAFDGLEVRALASLYGVSERAAAVLLLRATRELDAALQDRAAVAAPHERELEALPTFLDAWGRRAPVGPAASLVASAARRDELDAARAAAAAEAERSPRRRRETWLRWLTVALIVALSVFLSWRELTQRPVEPPDVARPR